MSDRAQELVARGIAAAEAGDKEQARIYLLRALAVDENNEEAWLWRGGLADDPQESVMCLERALAINPQSERAQEGLEWARARLEAARSAKAQTGRPKAAERPARRPSPREAKEFSIDELSRHIAKSRYGAKGRESSSPGVARAAGKRRTSPRLDGASARPKDFALRLSLKGMISTLFKGKRARQKAWVAALVFLLAGLAATFSPDEGWGGALVRLIAAPAPAPTIEELWRELDVVWANSDWPQAISLLQRVRERDADYDDVEEKLFAAHFNYGVQLVRQERLREAIAQFDEALKIRPHDRDAQGERHFAQLYLEGTESYEEGDWAQAIEKLRIIYDGNPNYRQVRERLYLSYFNYGQSLEAAGNLVEAGRQYRQALLVEPDGAEARAQLDRLKEMGVWSPEKRIEIDLNEQHLTAWEGDKVIYRFPCSTGDAAHPTRTGTFEVLDKIPKAYSPSWDLHMPYWLGVYWVDSMENGIHALPIDSDGDTLWAGYLGRQPVSLGCVVLDTPDAKKLYEWAEVGTPVVINP